MNLKEQLQYIKNNFSKIEKSNLKNDHLIIYVSKENILDLINFLKKDENLSFRMLIDLFGADMLDLQKKRFDIIYILLSFRLNNRITIKASLDEDQSIDTLCDIFPSANWLEREVFDMYGVKFDNHPDLRRILTDYGFEGHPLRKDFPLMGHKEMRYDEKQKKIIYEDIDMDKYNDENNDYFHPWIVNQN